MTLPVSLLPDALPPSDEERGFVLEVTSRLDRTTSEDRNEVAVWTAYERFEHSWLATRDPVPPRLTSTATELLPAGTEVLEAPPSEAAFDAWITPHALLVFGALHVVALLAWVFSDAPWTWRSAAVFAAVAAALVLAAALLRRPSRRLGMAGFAVAIVSFARLLGVEWIGSTWVAFLLTAALAAVLACAVVPATLARRLFARMARWAARFAEPIASR
jgi:hypothetical protein